jgi:hypothetical protein
MRCQRRIADIPWSFGPVCIAEFELVRTPIHHCGIKSVGDKQTDAHRDLHKAELTVSIEYL